MCTTMMGKPDSGIARGELRSTLSRAGSCRSSANNINEERRGQKRRVFAHVTFLSERHPKSWTELTPGKWDKGRSFVREVRSVAEEGGRTQPCKVR